jgi:small-conductance mechanosensitive channel
MRTANPNKVRNISFKKTATGLALLLAGVVLFCILAMPQSQTIINDSFVLEPNEKSGRIGVGYYHGGPGSLNRNLVGEISVQGKNVDFSANGTNEQNARTLLINVPVYTEYEFKAPINNDYTFSFMNPNSDQQSTVTFTLKAVWTSTTLLVMAFIALSISAPAGTTLVVLGLRSKTTRKA